MQKRISEWDETDATQTEPLNCIIRFNNGPDAQQLFEIEQTGLELVNITESILAVRGYPDAITEAAELGYVESISLQENDNPE